MNKGILIDKSQFFDNFTKKSILASKSPSENRQHHCNPTDCDFLNNVYRGFIHGLLANQIAAVAEVQDFRAVSVTENSIRSISICARRTHRVPYRARYTRADWKRQQCFQ